MLTIDIGIANIDNNGNTVNVIQHVEHLADSAACDAIPLFCACSRDRGPREEA